MKDRCRAVPHLRALDLRRVVEGVIRRDERFGDVELATHSFDPPWHELGPIEQLSPPPPFIRSSTHDGVARVTFDVPMAFDLASGKRGEWQRVEIE